MPGRFAGSAVLLWRVAQTTTSTEGAPTASLVSVAYASGQFYVVVRGDIPVAVDRPFDPEADIPTGRLRAVLEVTGIPAEPSSALSGADRHTWEALLLWEKAEPAPELRLTLELDGRSCLYVLVSLDASQQPRI